MKYRFFNEIDDPKMKGLDEKLMLKLDNARFASSVPFYITSGLRTEEENLKCGGVSDSAHLKGLACDLECSDSQNRFKIVYGLIVAGIRRIGLSSNHVHADIDNTKLQDVIFLE
jgi:zinc D-Ala-D-Ala carboxypeptidase